MKILNVWKLMLYGRKGLKMPSENFQVSNTDVLLKRRIKFE